MALFGIKRANELRKDGGAEGVRTPDLLNAIQALYQLSYDPIWSDGESKATEKNVKTNFENQVGAIGATS